MVLLPLEQLFFLLLSFFPSLVNSYRPGFNITTRGRDGCKEINGSYRLMIREMESASQEINEEFARERDIWFLRNYSTAVWFSVESRALLFG